MIEDQFTEFKLTYSDSIKKSVIAFLNTNEGIIYIGINDQGVIVGVDDPDNIMKTISSSIKNSIRPDCSQFFNMQLKNFDEKMVIQLSVVKGVHRPYYLGEKGIKPSGVFIRVGSTTVQAQEKKIRELIKRDDNDSFESTISFRQDLTFSYADELFFEKNIDFSENKKRTLGIFDSKGFYTNLGLLLSDQCEHTIKCAIFEGKTKDIFKDRKEFSGSLFKQIDDVVSYLNVYNKTASIIGNLERVDKREYSEVAIREAVLNAVIHRDYGLSGSILISLYDDRLEIVSPGGLIDGLSKETILIGISETRNKKLANVFYRLKYIEAYGTGIPRIVNDYRLFERKPEFNIFDGAFQIILPNKLYKGKNNSLSINKQEEKIINKLQNVDYTDKDKIAELLGITPNRAYKILENMLNKGLVLVEKKDRKKLYKLNNDKLV